MSLPPSATPPALLILAHKYDLLSSTAASGPPDQLAINRVRTILERELEKRKESQAGGLGMESLGGDGDAVEVSGLECSGSGSGGFRFSDWEGGEVVFLGTSVDMGNKDIVEDEKKSGSGLDALEQWLEDLP